MLSASHDQFPKKWALFLARYRLLTEFAAVEFHSIKGHTALGYETALKIGLAHTALEALQKARSGNHAIAIRDTKAARIVRKLRGSQFEKFLEGTSSSKALKERLEQMFSSQKAMDLSPMVEAIRNSVFHGSFTPYSAGFISNADVRLLLDLTFHLILDSIETEVGQFAQKLSVGSKP